MNLSICRNFDRYEDICIDIRKIRIFKVLYAFLFKDFKILGYGEQNKPHNILSVNNIDSFSMKKRKVKISSKSSDDNSSKSSNFADCKTSENDLYLTKRYKNFETSFYHSPSLYIKRYDHLELPCSKLFKKRNNSNSIFQRNKKAKMIRAKSPYIKVNKNTSFNEKMILELNNSKGIFKRIIINLLKNVRFEESTIISTFILIDKLYNKVKLDLKDNNVIINFLLSFVTSFQINEDSILPLNKILSIFSVSKADFIILQKEYFELMDYKLLVTPAYYDFYSKYIYEYLELVMKFMK